MDRNLIEDGVDLVATGRGKSNRAKSCTEFEVFRCLQGFSDAPRGLMDFGVGGLSGSCFADQQRRNCVIEHDVIGFVNDCEV